ncbi:extracellular solute-binding protein [Paenibacillus solisilvae]|uniref:Extracellular solute-binding protein n=1 Tax=Paenibacillus solisilvae TaxID=2486751 RepID=A0ABW0W186_9BACL
MIGSLFSKKSTILVLLLIAAIILTISLVGSSTAQSSSGTAINLTQSDLPQPVSSKKDGYDRYLLAHPSAVKPDLSIPLNLSQYQIAGGMAAEGLSDFQGIQGESVKTSDEGTISWDVDVTEDGLYNIGLTYYPIEGKSGSIERTVLIDGKLPFAEAANMQLPRVWGNQKPNVEQDNQGNDLRPEQAEKPTWLEAVFQDREGYYEKPFSFFLTKGKHNIALRSEREPVVIHRIELFQADDPLTYKELSKQYKASGYKETNNQQIIVQGESMQATSSPTLYPLADRSSPAVEPYDVSKIKINTVGGKNWRLPGQWISWNITVPKDGLYKIGFKAKQNFLRGLFSTRKLTVDGKVPFEEMENIPFYFENDWRMEVLGGDDNPYLFYLTEGQHELKLEVTLGQLAPLIRQVENSVLSLNEMYRKVLMITGATPDAYRDYQVEKQIPDLEKTFRSESDTLNKVADRLEQIAGASSSQGASLRTMADQLADLADRPETLPKRLASYNINVGALGTWILTVREQPLQIDAIDVSSPDFKLPNGKASFPARAWHEMRSFMYSFFIDYSNIGNVSKSNTNRSITVWIGSGRDQSQVVKAMIDDTFTPKSGISVNVKLVPLNTLLPATLAGQGPDVAMQVSSDIPVNYAMRDAVADLAQFPDYAEVAKRFRDSAVVPYRYEAGTYALPETQTFNMLFYRKDIMEQLHLKIPNTWDEVYDMLPVLNKNHMLFGLQRPPAVQAYQNPDPNSTMAMLLYQNGGQFYTKDGKESALSSEAGMKAFKEWTEFYTDYGLPVEFDFANRFRTGEMPIGLADYSVYNQLAVSAPEIRGLWGFVPVPGIKQADGQIHREVAGNGSAVVMMKQADDKQASWEFMKWWTDESTQTTFGREMEGLMGAAARYPTANIAALEKLPWPLADYKNLTEQFKWVRGIPQVPGGYFLGRHLDNAFWKVVNVANTGARETLEDYIETINQEIKLKRREFNLPNN